MKTNTHAIIAALSICALLTPATLCAEAHVERPFKMQAHGILRVSLVDGSYEAVESGQATHTGRFQNDYTGYFDLENLVFFSGAGATTAANGDQIFWQVIPPSGAGAVTGGTGRFEGAAGTFTWATTDVILSVDLNSMTLMIIYNYTGSGTLTF